MKCLVCGFPSTDKLCFKHSAAARSLSDGYNAWKTALGISFDEYLEEVLKNKETGTWVVDVIKYIIETKDSSILNL